MANLYALKRTSTHDQRYLICNTAGGFVGNPVAKKINIFHEGKIVFTSMDGWLTDGHSSNNCNASAIESIEFVKKRELGDNLTKMNRSFVVGDMVYIHSNDLTNFEVLESEVKIDHHFCKRVAPRVSFHTTVTTASQNLKEDNYIFKGKPEFFATDKSEAAEELELFLKKECHLMDVNSTTAIRLFERKDELLALFAKIENAPTE